ncbi:AAA family ATPase [Nocardia otitidiscaviarum]|nr:BTAD domain-containing putative transcriptional regulator [Nocardia otitidiscaviarum]MCP9624075.1 AAA family ATPase [Nocardia otitidiscaviarum]
MDRHDAESGARTGLRFIVLNGVEVERDGIPVPLGPPQRRALLCALAFRRRQWVSARTLLDALYDGAAPASGIGVVRTHISALRRALEPNRPPRTAPMVLLSGHGGYQLRIDDDRIDLGVFDRLVADAELVRADPVSAQQRYRRALGLWSGEPLAGMPGPYAESQRIALIERRLAVVEDSLEVDLTLKQADHVIECTRQLLADHPLRERAAGLLMRALAERGRRAEALTTYTRIRRRLVDELGVEPGAELCALQARILNGGTDFRVAATPLPVSADPAPQLDPAPPLDEATPGPGFAAGPQHLSPPTPGAATPVRAGSPLTSHGATPSHEVPTPTRNADAPLPPGRREQVDRILAAHRRTIAGAGGVVLISGYPGYGKTALLEAVAQRIPSSYRASLAAPGGREPRVLDIIHAALGAAEIEPTHDLPTLVDRVRDLLVAVSVAHPLVLLLDDVTDGDEPSLRLLTALAPALRSMPVLIVVAFDDRPWYPLVTSEWHAALERGAITTVRLAGLGPAAIGALAARELGRPCPAELAADIHRATAGMPVLVTALLDDLRLLDDPRTVPARLPGGGYARAVRHQLSRYSVDGGRMLRAIAALQHGEPPLAVLAAACEQDAAEFRERCELLVTVGILDDAARPRLCHPLFATTLLRLAAPEEIERIRLAAARQARRESCDPRTVARYLHGLRGERWSGWVPALLEAADEAARHRDLTEAADHLTAALRIAGSEQREHTLIRLGQLKLWTDPAAAREYFDEALTSQRSLGVTPTAVIPLAWVLATGRQADAARTLVEEVIAETAVRDPAAAVPLRASMWMIAALTDQSWRDFVARLRREPVRDTITAAVLSWDDAFAVRCSAQQALARFPMFGSGDHLPREIGGIVASVAMWADDLTLACQLSEQLDDRSFGDLDVYRRVVYTEALLRGGHYTRALAQCDLIGTDPARPVTRRPAALVAQYAHALLGLGRADEAEHWLDSVTDQANPEAWEWTVVKYVRALVCAARGRAREAATLFLDCGRRTAAKGLANPAHIAWRSSAALQLVSLGETARARELATAELELALRWNTPYTLGRAYRAVALTSDESQTIPLLHRAVDHLRHSETVTELVLAEIDLSDALRRAGDDRAAREHLLTARDIAAGRGATLFTDRIDARLRSLAVDRRTGRDPAQDRAVAEGRMQAAAG